jgi:hypothetical protein
MPTLSISHALRLAVMVMLAIVAAPTSTRAEGAHDGQHDFDFMYGRWKIQVRRLKTPLHGAHDWYDLEGTTECHPFWNGQGNFEQFEADGPSGHISAIMVRLYSPKSRQWSLNWASRDSARFEAPTVGEFKDGRGEFYDQELFEGRSILVRYVWSNITSKSGHFEQSFSADGGKTWEANWIAQSTRVE